MRAPNLAAQTTNRTSMAMDYLSGMRSLAVSPMASLPCRIGRRHQSNQSNQSNSAAEKQPTSLTALSTKIFNPELSYISHPTGYTRSRRDPASSPGRPDNIAYFTANARYYNLVLKLNDAIRMNGLDFEDKSVYFQKAMPSWMNRIMMEEKHDMNLGSGRYEEIIHKLSMLFAIRSTDRARAGFDRRRSDQRPTSFTENDAELSEVFFAPFVKPGTAFAAERERKIKTIDADGFAKAKGSRKTARATVKTIEGDGVIMVNGMLASEYFENHLTFIEDMVEPLTRTGRIGKYNVWADVRGGGLSGEFGAECCGLSITDANLLFAGQAQAVKLAVARCLVIHEPQLEAGLSEGWFRQVVLSESSRSLTFPSSLQLDS